jgi:ornithine carbamoyltransferase
VTTVTPIPTAPPAEIIGWARGAGARVIVTHDPQAAVAGADAVVTDTWVSMDQESDAAKLGHEMRHNMLAPFRVDRALMARARPDAIFMHCLPAHRGEEVTDEILDGPIRRLGRGREPPACPEGHPGLVHGLKPPVSEPDERREK